jgi:hypothetical protein
MVWKARVGNDPLQLDITKTGVSFPQLFLKTFQALRLIFSLTNTGIPHMVGLKTLPFSKARNLLRMTLTFFTSSWWYCERLWPSRAQLKPS